MMSNRLANLVSPIVDRNFQFNSQVSGIAPRVLLETTPNQQTIEVNESVEEIKQVEAENNSAEKSPDNFETESPLKEDPDNSSSHLEEDQTPAEDDALMQEINISLESPREEEKGHTPERKSNNEQHPRRSIIS